MIRKVVTMLKEKLQILLNAEYEKGYEKGIEFIKQKMISVCDTDKPIAIESRGVKRAFFVQSDLKHLQKLFDDIEKSNA